MSWWALYVVGPGRMTRPAVCTTERSRHNGRLDMFPTKRIACDPVPDRSPAEPRPVPSPGGGLRSHRDAHLLGSAHRPLCLQAEEAGEFRLPRLQQPRGARALLPRGVAPQPAHRPGRLSGSPAGHRQPRSTAARWRRPGPRPCAEDAPVPAERPAVQRAGPRRTDQRAHRRAGP
ncbi:hypothetical protein D3C81_1249900 [compost metagenome]